MRKIAILIGLTLLASRGVAEAQSFELYGSGGPTVTDDGTSFAVGAGFSPTPHLTLAVSFDRTHLASRPTWTTYGGSSFRGGTLSLGAAEVRVTPFVKTRVRPFGLIGFAAGTSRPNVTEIFQDRITNQVRAMFIGGGVDVPINDHFAFLVDGRVLVGAEGNEGTVGVVPVRAGVAWRF